MAPISVDDLVKHITESGSPNNEYYQNYHTNYEIAQHVLGESKNRKIRILNVGTGLASINLAYHLSQMCENFDLAMIEKASSLGGVWNHNRYPGIACDLPSLIYQFSWAPNPDWSHLSSSGPEIRAYFEKVCDVLDLKKYMVFNTEVLRAVWNEKGFWEVTLRKTSPGEDPVEYVHEADVLVNNSGLLHKFKWPEVEGLDKFKGKLLHTAQWDESFGEKEWQDKTIAVIGSGASSLQIVPKIQPHLKKLVVYSRSPVWFSPNSGTEGNHPYDDETRKEWRSNPSTMIKLAKEAEAQMNGMFPALAANGSDIQKTVIQLLHAHMAETVKDPALLEGFLPTFAPGCRRITPGDAFLEAVQKPNAEVIFKSVVSATEEGLVDQDGDVKKVDAIICATGFLTDLIPTFDIVGKSGLRMADAFAEKQDAYMGISVPDFPNYFYGTGPYWTAANGPPIGAWNATSKYVAQVVRKLQTEVNILSINPTRSATDDFVEHTQAWLKGAVWTGKCPSYYQIRKGPHKGRVDSIWPGITLHFVRAIATPRWEDYDIQYAARTDGSAGNRFNYLGKGFVPENFDETLDDSPHIGLHNIDRRWAEAIGLQLDN